MIAIYVNLFDMYKKFSLLMETFFQIADINIIKCTENSERNVTYSSIVDVASYTHDHSKKAVFNVRKKNYLLSTYKWQYHSMYQRWRRVVLSLLNPLGPSSPLAKFA